MEMGVQRNGDEIEMFGDGTSKRDYTFVADIVDGIIKSLDLDAGFEIINLGNSNPIELNKLISLIEKTLNKKAKIVSKGEQPGDVIRTYADIKTAEDLLGYSPKVNIEEGIKMLCEWYVKNRANK